jgi:8-oxo-dGTP pyrophosphatase MutT (NUDIX family)
MPRTIGPIVAPAQRQRIVRRAVRVLLLDPDGRALLFQDSDPNIGARWWILPGGGIDSGEEELDAVVREIAEETGLVLERAAVQGPLARRRVVHGFSDVIIEQTESFYAARTRAFEVSVAGHTELEQQTLQQHRWWSRAELESAAEQIWPARLLEIWDLLAAPQGWGLDLGDVEESSVPV